LRGKSNSAFIILIIKKNIDIVVDTYEITALSLKKKYIPIKKNIKVKKKPNLRFDGSFISEYFILL
jgi:hypothetical protein